MTTKLILPTGTKAPDADLVDGVDSSLLMTTAHPVNSITGFGTTTANLAVSAAAGSATTISRSDHVHSTTGLMLTSHSANSITGFGGTGAATTVARSDHSHLNLTGWSDTRAVATVPNDYNSSLKVVGIKSSTASGTLDGSTYATLVGIRGWTDSSGGNSHELAFTGNGELYQRSGATTAWGNWRKMLTSADIGSSIASLSSPTFTGTVTAPTFSGNLSGNATTATSAGKWTTARTITLDGDVSGSVSLDGSANVTLTTTVADDSHNHIISNVDNLQSALDSKTPFSTLSAVTAATAGWYRIATSAVNIGANSGLFKVEFNGTGVMGRCLFIASCHNGTAAGSAINQLGFTTTNGTLGLTQARVVYHTTYTGNYAYVEVYNPTALAITYTVDLIDSTGWSLVTPNTVGSIPTGYTSEALTFDTGYVSMEDVTATRQLVSKIATGTAPLVVSSTTTITNLSADMVDNVHLSGLMQTSHPANAITGLSATTPAMNGTATIGTATTVARADHIHPTDTTRAAVGQTMYIGTTAVTINRASAALALTGITSIDGNSATATKLAASKTINNVAFDGSANITVPTIYDADYRRIVNPVGAVYTCNTATVTGAIAISLPVGMTGQMMRMTIKVYEYSTNRSFEVHCGGYMYGTGSTWANNPFAYIVGNPSIDRRLTVRFGYNSTTGKAVIYIGELTSTWAYPQIEVTDVLIGYAASAVAWTTGWSIGFEASAFQAVTATVTNAQVGYAVSTNTANSTVLRDASGNFSAGTITAALSGNATSATTAATATKLATTRTISLTGAISGSATFDGSADATITTTMGNVTGSLQFQNLGVIEFIDIGGTIKSDGWFLIDIDNDSNSTTDYFRVTKDNGGTVLFNVAEDGSVTAGWNKIWHEGNDGSGSGLDADLLRGLYYATAATGNTIVARDSDGNFSANIITATLSGNANSASKLVTPRHITLSGAVTGDVDFDGSADITITTTISAVPWTSITSKPTTVSGYGITNAMITSHAANAITGFGTTAAALGTTSAGTATTISRSDHVHTMPTLDALSNTTITSNVAGEILKWSGTAWVNNTLAEAGIMATSHAANSITGFGTTAVALGTAAAGTATTISRSDHVHPTTGLMLTSHAANSITGFGTTAAALGTAAAGTATTISRSDHVHPTTGLALLSGATFTGAVTLSGDPTADLHAVPRRWVQGRPAKDSARVATTANLVATITASTLTNSGTNAVLVIDGVTLVAGDRVLVKNQSNPAQNGIFEVTNAGSTTVPWVLTRSPGGDVWDDLVSAIIGVDEGTTNINTMWFCTAIRGGTVGTTAINWQLISNTQVASLGNLATTGFVTRTAANTFTGRTIAVSGTGLSITNADGVSGNPTITSNATSANTASTIVARDSSGNFSAGTITATLSGNATSATTAASATKLATARTINGVSFDGTANITIPTMADPMTTTGDIIYRSSTGTTRLPIGSAGQVLTVVSGVPSWAAANNSSFATDITVNGLTVGRGAGNNSTNTALGANALGTNAAGGNNVAIGNYAMYTNKNSKNVAVGDSALYSNSGGANNVAIGYSALYTTNASKNIGIGDSALYSNTTGSSNIAIGYNTSNLNATDTNSIVIGTDAVGKGSNTVTIGNDNITDTYLKGTVHGNISLGIVNETSVSTVVSSPLPIGDVSGNFIQVSAVEQITVNSPAYGICSDSAGNIWVGILTGKVIKIAAGTTTIAATISTSSVRRICIDPSDNVWAAGSSLYKIAAGTTVVAATVSGISSPIDCCSDPSGNIWVISNSGIYKIAVGTTTIAATITGVNYPSRICSDPSGNIWVTNTGANTVLKIAAGTTAIANTISGITSPFGICSDSKGNIWITSKKDKTVSKINVGTTTIANTITGCTLPADICVDLNDNIWVGNYTDNTVAKILAGTTKIVAVFPEFNITQDLCVDLSGNIWVSNEGVGKISKIRPPVSGVVDSIPIWTTAPIAICRDSIGNIWVPGSNGSSSVLYKIDAKTSTLVTTITGFNQPQAICCDLDDNIWVTNNYGNSVFKIEPRTGTITNTITGFNYPYGVCNDPSGNIWVTNNSGNSVSKITAGTTTIANTITGFNAPRNICSDPSGNIWIANYGANTVIKIAVGTTTIAATVLAASPTGICSDPDGNIWVTGATNIYKIAVGTTTIANTISGVSSPTNICSDFGGNIWVTDSNNSKIYKIAAGTVTIERTITYSYASAIYPDLDGNIWVASGLLGGSIGKIATGYIVSAFDTTPAGARREIKFGSNILLVHNSQSLILPGKKPIVTNNNDCATFISLDNGNWICTKYQLANEFSAPHGRQLFESSGTFVVPSGITKVLVTISGGGGGGGSGGSFTSVTNGGGGSGGGAGAFYYQIPISVTPGQSIAVTVGAGGAGGASSSSAAGKVGSAGGLSSFGTYLTASPGGGGGGGRILEQLPAKGGASGFNNFFGVGGDGGFTSASSTNGTGPYAGIAATDTGGGAGGGGVCFIGTFNVCGGSGGTGGGNPGQNALGYGGGGGGGGGSLNRGSGAGGNGGPGFVLVEW